FAVVTQLGHTVEIASDGWEALMLAARERPALVMVELHLPTTDGWSFIETLRAEPSTADVPVIFMASNEQDRVPGPSFRDMIDDWLEKPFRLEALEKTIREGLARARIP